MNRFLKNNSTWIGWMSLALLIILLAFVFRPNPPEYKLNEASTLKQMTDPSLVVSVSELAGKQTIDIRSEELFARGHAENAVNIPVRHLLDKESIQLFKQMKNDGIVAVLYGSSELQAVSPWLMLQQLGYQNILRLKGYFTSANKLAETDPAFSEKALPDSALFKAKATAEPSVTAVNTATKQPEAIKPVKREASKSGGC
jgi:rhodanese-related sulfurtransferase